MSYLSSKKVLIRSKDRVNPTTTPRANFSLRFQESIEGEWDVKWITIPNTLYNVNATNNIIPFTNTDGSYTATMVPGNYTTTTLATEIDRAMDAAASGGATPITYTTTLVAATQTFSIASSASTTSLTFATNSTNTAHALMGFEQVDVATASPLVSTNSAFLIGPLSLGIQIPQSSGSGYITGGGTFQQLDSRSITKADGKVVSKAAEFVSAATEGNLVVPLLVSYGTYNFTSEDVFRQRILFSHGTKRIEVQVVDPDTGDVVDLNGGEWELMMERVGGLPSKRKRQRYTAPTNPLNN